jgi:hypothetical protein
VRGAGWSRRGGDALSGIVCDMNQKLTGSRCIVVPAVIPEVENIHTGTIVKACPTRQSSIGVCRA